MPSSCTGQAGCPLSGHVLDRPGSHFMYWTGWEPISCTGQAGSPFHVLDRLGSGHPVHVQERLGAQVMLKKGSFSGKGCRGHVLERVAQVMF